MSRARWAVVVALVFTTACGTVAVDRTDDLDADSEYLVLPARTPPRPQVFSALEGSSVPVVPRDLRKEIEGRDGVIFVTTADCAPCRGLEEKLNQLLSASPEISPPVRLEVHSRSDAEPWLSVREVPVLLRLRKGQVQSRFIGDRSEKLLREFLSL